MRGSSPTSSTILTRAWEQRAHTKCSTCGHPFTCSPRDPRVPPRARWTDLQESFLRLKTTVLPMTKNARPVGVMNGADSGTFGQRCRRLRGQTNPRRRVAIVDQPLGSSASVPGEFAPVAGSDWHDRCVTHRDFCENRLVDVEV